MHLVFFLTSWMSLPDHFLTYAVRRKWSAMIQIKGVVQIEQPITDLFSQTHAARVCATASFLILSLLSVCPSSRKVYSRFALLSTVWRPDYFSSSFSERKTFRSLYFRRRPVLGSNRPIFLSDVLFYPKNSVPKNQNRNASNATALGILMKMRG